MGGASVAAGRVTRFLASYLPELKLDSMEEQHDPSEGDLEFEFLNDGEILLGDSNSSEECDQGNGIMDLDEEDETENKNRSFWDSKQQNLQASLCRTSSLEASIRQITKEALVEIENAEAVCGCICKIMAMAVTSCPVTGCKKCLMKEVSMRLQKAGYNAAICKTKWKKSQDIPSGEHDFLDVTENTKKGEVRVIVELNFRAEFEMARGSEDYNKLVKRLPEVFVGKAERLSNLIKIMCMAAKRCMKEKKMHMGPWRKYGYMEAKWLGPSERNTSTTSLSMPCSEIMPMPMPKPKPKSSLLTVDLVEKLANMHCAPVEVV